MEKEALQYAGDVDGVSLQGFFLWPQYSPMEAMWNQNFDNKSHTQQDVPCNKAKDDLVVWGCDPIVCWFGHLNGVQHLQLQCDLHTHPHHMKDVEAATMCHHQEALLVHHNNPYTNISVHYIT